MTGKIFKDSLLVGVCAMLACGILFFAVMFSDYHQQVQLRLQHEAQAVSCGVEQLGADYFRDFGKVDRVTWVAGDGTVLYDSETDAAGMDNHAEREEIREALKSGSGSATRYSETLSRQDEYYAMRLSDGTVVRLGCSYDSITTILSLLLTPLLWSAVLVLIICAVVAFRLASSITRPLNAMDLDALDSDGTYPELRPLVRRLREQSRTIGQQMAALSQKQQEFTAITENMSEGFLLLDREGVILSGNHSAMQLLTAGGDPAQRPLSSVCEKKELLDAVSAALSGDHTELVCRTGETTYQIIGNCVRDGGRIVGAVVLLLDITEREQREVLRREFSANVSHELKTPLTSISGFAELMKEGLAPTEKMLEFSADIYRESMRLIDLVNDIIKLSMLDEQSAGFEWEQVDLYAVCEQTIADLRPSAEKKQVRMKLVGTHETVRGVGQLVREMVRNLCDNAIKYNVEGGAVTVTVEKAAASVAVRVADTGIGIPYAHQSRVFERFYRVDKSHSKEVGGTGLGLSIVKHAAQVHRAKLELRSGEGMGTAISVFFPV